MWLCCVQAKPEAKNGTEIPVQSRAEHSAYTRKADKAKTDMHSVLQQHLVGPSMTAPAAAVTETKNDLWFKFGSKEEGKKGKLQTVGSVIGDIIGVLVSEIARFFGSVVSDVAREVTAHGFVSLFKQIADFTRSSGSTGASISVSAPVS